MFRSRLIGETEHKKPSQAEVAKERGPVKDKQRNIKRTSENRDSSPLPRGRQTKQGYLIFSLTRKGCQNRDLLTE